MVEFAFDVMAAANELLLDRLVQICSRVVLSPVNIANVCNILSEATYYHAAPLVRILQGYMAQNMETLLEGRMLDDLAADLVKQLSAHVRAEQAAKSHVTRSGALVATAMAKWSDWLALQDIARPIQPLARPLVSRDAKLSPPLSSRRPKSPEASPSLRPQVAARSNRNSVVYHASEDELFVMDGVESVPPLSLGQEHPAHAKGETIETTPKSVSWKVPSAPKYVVTFHIMKPLMTSVSF